MIHDSQQHTVKRSISCCGVGLHSGHTVNLTIKPAAAGHGIAFVRTDLPGAPVIPARPEQVSDTRLATTLGQGEARVSTTEHLMAALFSCGIDNAVIEVDAPEIPIMDGSAGPFILLLKRVGRKAQQARRQVLRITRPISYQDGQAGITITPHDGLRVTGEIDFDDALIKKQSYSLDCDGERFHREIARARTFGYVEQVEELWANGLALGGTLENVIAIHWNRRTILNEDGLRFDDEFIRHKVLDLIGDLALLGMPLMGEIRASRCGHSQHLAFMKEILAHPECWQLVELQDQPPAKRHRSKSIPLEGSLLSPLFVSPNSLAPRPC